MKRIYNKRLPAFMLVLAGSILLSSCYKKFDPASYAPKLSIGGYTSSAEIAPGNLVGYWSFNGSLVDSVTGQAGTNTGTTFTAGVKGQALQGADQSYVVFDPSSALQNLQSFTITCWVNSPQNTNGIVGLFDLANTTSFWGNLDIFFENGSTDTKAILKIHVNNNGTDAWLGNYEIANIWNVWTNIAITYDAASSTFKVFVNGSKIATQTQAGYGPLVFQNATKAVFGTVQFQTSPSLTSATDAQPWASYLTGSMDEFRIYNTALGESDVSALVKLEGRGK
jgi:hypothetical protein